MAQTSKKSGRKNTRNARIEEAANLAAEEAVAELEQEESAPEFEDDGDNSPLFLQSQAVNAVDVFEEAFKKALKLNDAPRFHIKKNSQFLTVKDYPYSWEKLQADYGPGYYQIIAKRRSNGQLLKMQTEMVGDPNEGREEVADSDNENVEDKNLQMLAYLQSQQERAESRAREASKSSETGLAAVLQAITASTQKSTELMMTMFIEQSKQTQNMMMAMMQQTNQPKTDPLIPLLTTLLSKPQDTGLKPLEVFKMVKDAERDAREQANRTNDLIDKRAKELAEVMAESGGGEGEEKEESFTKTLVKGFLPVLSQIMAQQQAAGQHIAEGREQVGAQAALNEGFVEEPQKMIPASPAAPVRRPHQAARPPQAGARTAAPQNGAPSVQATSTPATAPQELRLDARQKEAVFNFCAADIGQAMIGGANASSTASEVLKKLEIQGLSRQTVASSFTLEDFYGFAEKYVPAESMDAAKVWLKEFFDAVQNPQSSQPVRSAGTGGPTSGAEPVRDVTANGNGTKPPVAQSRSKSAVPRARAQSREPSKNI